MIGTSAGGVSAAIAAATIDPIEAELDADAANDLFL